jgi:hypothetical protein
MSHDFSIENAGGNGRPARLFEWPLISNNKNGSFSPGRNLLPDEASTELWNMPGNGAFSVMASLMVDIDGQYGIDRVGLVQAPLHQLPSCSRVIGRMAVSPRSLSSYQMRPLGVRVSVPTARLPRVVHVPISVPLSRTS